MRKIKINDKKIFVLTNKFKDFLVFGIENDFNGNHLLYFFFEDLTKKGNVNLIKYFNMDYFFFFSRIIKRNFIYFSKYFFNFKGGSIYCVSISYDFFFNYLDFINKNKDILKKLNISFLLIMFKGFLYNINLYLNENIFKFKEEICTIIFDVFNFFNIFFINDNL